MKKMLLVLPVIILSGCNTAKTMYVQQDWSMSSLEQAKAECQLQTAKEALKSSSEHFSRYRVMEACMESKGWKKQEK